MGRFAGSPESQPLFDIRGELTIFAGAKVLPGIFPKLHNSINDEIVYHVTVSVH